MQPSTTAVPTHCASPTCAVRSLSFTIHDKQSWQQVFKDAKLVSIRRLDPGRVLVGQVVGVAGGQPASRPAWVGHKGAA